MSDKDLSFFKDAACKGRGSEEFFPEYRVDNYRKLVQATKDLCRGCPVRQECLDYALKYEPLGIWGGMTEKERRAYRREFGITLIESRGVRIW